MQKTAYELRIRVWSSDVCSSDLRGHAAWRAALEEIDQMGAERIVAVIGHDERQILHFDKFAVGQAVDECRRVIRRQEFAHPSADIERRQHDVRGDIRAARSEEHTSTLKTLMRT